ncbi:MAG: hypothetical protein HC820_02395, partial [Hydrococcus sp. RM1_1_31]|nr:hypothetical protein [Hydrococcus sp. RM1_1_31]
PKIPIIDDGDFLRRREMGTTIQTGGNVSTETVVSSPPIEISPSSPNKKLLIGIGIAAAVVIPVAFLIVKMTSNTPSFPRLATDGQFSEGILTAENVLWRYFPRKHFLSKYAIGRS